MPVDESLLHGWFYGNLLVREIGAVGFAFLMGTIPFGPTAVWLFADMDRRILRAAAGLAPLLDVAKAFAPTLIAAHGGGSTVGLCAGLAAVAGDCYSPWRRFRGGTGNAAEFGALLAVCWPAGVTFGVVWFVCAVASNYAAIGSLTAAAFAFVPLWFFLGAPGAIMGALAGLAVASRHGVNFARLRDGCEPTMRRSPAAAPSVVRLRGEPVQSF
jgi:glycerol-3-phosphate acyltransferase PlsY